MTTLAAVFERARAEERAVLIGYLPAGFPTTAESVALIRAMVAGGVDVVEVGLPYSDPLMDGPAIQQAVEHALAGGTTTDTVLDVVGEVATTDAPVLVMTYWNPIERYGVDRFADRLADVGGVGAITPDLTPEEAGPWIAATDRRGLSRVFLVAPSSTDERIGIVTSVTGGFVYAASMMGVTGSQSAVSAAAPPLVARTHLLTELPVAVGLGVSTGEQAAEVAAYADGVIVGSAFVRAVLGASDHADALVRVGALAEELAAGVRNRTLR